MKMLSLLISRSSLWGSFFISSILFFGSCSGPSGDSHSENGPQDQGAKKGSKEDEAVALFFGNSLTAGKGVDPDEAFPALIQDRIDSLGWAVDVVNSGVSGETSSGGESRIDWVLQQQEIDLFVLELGANDGLRGIDPAETRKNLQTILDKVQKEYPKARIVLAGMKVPPNMGSSYSKKFRAIYPRLAEKNKIELIPFLLKGVAGKEDLNQSDGIHPTAEGHRIIAENVWKVIRDEIRAIAPDQKAKASNGSDNLQLDGNRGREG
ncbi:MAG: arylesterase [Flavobacteriales bacterium]